MKLLNIDELSKVTRTLTIGGVEHPVIDMSVENFIETQKEAEKLEKSDSTVTHIEASVRMIVRAVPTLTEDQLKKLSLTQLGMILKFINGELDEEAKQQGEEKTPEKEGKGSKKKVEQEVDFGFAFSRVCMHYGMGYREVMGMPIRAFWLMHTNISRCLAERDLRSLTVATVSQDSKAVKEVRERLIIEMGEAGTRRDGPISEERDEEGIAFLRSTGGL